MKKYFTPISAFTCALWQQPTSEPTSAQTIPGWSLDAGMNYIRTEFLDAPDIIPSGSVVGLDCAGITIGVCFKRRE